MSQILLKEECYRIQGAIIEVYRTKGCGFLEAVYQECLEIEFEMRGIEFLSQPIQELDYKGRKLKQTYKPDFIVMNSVIVELKALSEITGDHEAQVLNYLKATRHKVGLLVNFGHYPKAEIKRLVL